MNPQDSVFQKFDQMAGTTTPASGAPLKSRADEIRALGNKPASTPVANPLKEAFGPTGTVAKDINQGAEDFAGTVNDLKQGRIGSALVHTAKAITHAGLEGASDVVSGVFSPVAQALQPVFRKLASMPGVSGAKNNELVKSMSDWADKNPEAAKGLGALFNLGTVGLGGGAAAEAGGKAVDAVGSAVKDLGEKAGSVKDAAIDTGTKMVDKFGDAPKTSEEAVGKITQAKPKDIFAAKRGLSGIDASKVKTFEDLSGQLDSQIKESQAQVDAAFDKNKNTYTADKLNKEFPTKEGPITHNFVSDAITHLEELYTKTSDPAALAKIKDLKIKYEGLPAKADNAAIEAKGLTPTEINNLAKQYGSEFKGKAFAKVSGDPLTSVNAQAYENTRTGVKEAARELMPDEATRAVDKQTSDMIKTKALSDKMVVKVQQLENKFQKAGAIGKIGGAIGKALDILNGGFAKGLLKGVSGLDTSGGTLDAIEIQNNLQANLKTLERLNSLSPKDAAIEISKLNGATK